MFCKRTWANQKEEAQAKQCAENDLENKHLVN
jgi:hypothetical protein